MYFTYEDKNMQLCLKIIKRLIKSRIDMCIEELEVISWDDTIRIIVNGDYYTTNRPFEFLTCNHDSEDSFVEIENTGSLSHYFCPKCMTIQVPLEEAINNSYRVCNSTFFTIRGDPTLYVDTYIKALINEDDKVIYIGSK